MKNLALRSMVKYQAWRMHTDEEGLSLLSYALGAAVITAPLAAALFLFGSDVVTSAAGAVKEAITPTQ